MNSSKILKVALADDHEMVNEALGKEIDRFDGYRVIHRARNGKELIEQLQYDYLPDLVIVDIDMPIMDGQATAKWFRKNYPDILLMALTTYDSEVLTIMLIQIGVRGVVTKDMKTHDLKRAIDTVARNEFFFSNQRLVNLLRPTSKNIILANNIVLSEKELLFLKLICCDLCYKEIAQQMSLSVRTVEKFRDGLLVKLNAKSKTGLVTYAIKSGIVSKDDY
jgi:DNA-binding NarL/FixJ family response regulator